MAARLCHFGIHLVDGPADAQPHRDAEPDAALLCVGNVLEDAARPRRGVVDQKVDVRQRLHRRRLARLGLFELLVEDVEQAAGPVFGMGPVRRVLLAGHGVEEAVERAARQVPLNVGQDARRVHGCLLFRELVRRGGAGGGEAVNLEAQPGGKGGKVLELVHGVQQDLVTDEGQAADNVEHAADLRRGEANVIACIVELGEPPKATEDDGAAFEAREKVLVNEVA